MNPPPPSVDGSPDSPRKAVARMSRRMIRRAIRNYRESKADADAIEALGLPFIDDRRFPELETWKQLAWRSKWEAEHVLTRAVLAHGKEGHGDGDPMKSLRKHLDAVGVIDGPYLYLTYPDPEDFTPHGETCQEHGNVMLLAVVEMGNVVTLDGGRRRGG